MIVNSNRREPYALEPLRCCPSILVPVVSWRVLVRIIVSIMPIIGQGGQNIVGPLWIYATNKEIMTPSRSNNTTQYSNHTQVMDNYFILSFPTLFSVIIFAILLLAIKYFKPDEIGEAESKFPRKYLIAVGILDAVSRILLMFANPLTRTNLIEQAVLQNLNIPFVILARLA